MNNQAKKYWQMKQAVKNEAGKTEAEIMLYGAITSQKWWDEQNAVTSREFDEDLKALGNVDIINVRINSGGGDIFEAQAIYSMLKRHSATKNVFIDGIAASAATIVAMAGDKIIMPSGSMMMIHNPSTIAWGDANAMRDTADMLDKVRDSIVAVYQTKTTMTEKEIIKLMNAETWLTAKEALEKGFADEIEEEKVVDAVQNDKVIIINGITHDLSKYNNVPKFEATRVAAQFVPSIVASLNKKISNKEEGQTMNLDHFKNEYPELYNEVRNAAHNEGVQAERNRIKAIEDIAMPGNEEIINKAKFETGISAEQVAIEIIMAEKQKGSNFLNSRNDDVTSSNVQTVQSAAAPQNTSDQTDEAAAQSIAEAMNKKRGIK